MGVWIFMFVMTALIPVSLLVMWRQCLKSRSMHVWSGYRSQRSMRNQETWIFAQQRCAVWALRLFVPTALLCLLTMPFLMHANGIMVAWVGLGVVVVQLLSYALIGCFTEAALKKRFKDMD